MNQSVNFIIIINFVDTPSIVSQCNSSCYVIRVRDYFSSEKLLIYYLCNFISFTGLSIMAVTVFCGIVGCCFQSVFKKSIFTISGAAQAIAGICVINFTCERCFCILFSRNCVHYGRDAVPHSLGRTPRCTCL